MDFAAFLKEIDAKSFISFLMIYRKGISSKSRQCLSILTASTVAKNYNSRQSVLHRLSAVIAYFYTVAACDYSVFALYKP